MARIRTIKPTFFLDQRIAALPAETRLTFIGLWTYVDDEGRAVDDARLIKAAIWPLDDGYTAAEVESDLAQLAAAQRIRRYRSNGESFLHVCNWSKHQRINRPATSALPEPPAGAITEDSVSPHGAITEDAPEPAETATDEPSRSHHGAITEPSRRTHGAITEDSVSHHGGRTEEHLNDPLTSENEPSVSTHGGFTEPSVSPHGAITEGSVPEVEVEGRKSKSKSSSSKSLGLEPPELGDDDDHAAQENPETASELVIRAACHLVAIAELAHLRASRPDLDNPPPRSERELAWLGRATEGAWRRFADQGRKLLADEPELDAQQLAAALTPVPVAQPAKATRSAEQRRQAAAEAKHEADKRADEIEAARRARADELLAIISAGDREKLLAEITERLGPRARATVVTSAMRLAALDRAGE